MSKVKKAPVTPSVPLVVWAGRILTGLVCLMFAMSGVMKLVGGEQLAEGMEHLGLPASLVVPLAILEITCVIVYAIPATSVLGAILLTGYIGGAICTHLRVGDPFYVQIALGAVVWLGLFLQEPRLASLIPIRTRKK